MNYSSDTSSYPSESPPVEPARGFVPFVVYGLMAANVLMFLLTALGGGFIDTNDETLHRYGMLYTPDILQGQWWRLGSAMFLHAGIIHIAFNMWALKNLGEELEQIYGPAVFLLLYLGAGWVGSLASRMCTGAAVGASGAIFGLGGAWLAIALRNRRYFQEFGQQVLTVIGINLLIGFSSSMIDNNGHIGGLIGGFLLGLALPNRLPEFRSARWRWPVAAALLILFLAATPIAMRLAPSTLLRSQ